jgi:adenylate cyclase
MKSFDNPYFCLVEEKQARRQGPLFVKLSAILGTVVLLTSLVLSVFMAKQQRDILYKEKVKAGEIILKHLVNNVRVPLLGDDTLGLNTLVRGGVHLDGLLYVIVVDSRKIIKAHTDSSKIGFPLQGFENAKKIPKNGDVLHLEYTLPSRVRVLNLSRPVMFMHKIVGTVHLGLSLDFVNRAIEREARSMLHHAFLWSAFLAITATGAALFLSKRIGNAGRSDLALTFGRPRQAGPVESPIRNTSDHGGKAGAIDGMWESPVNSWSPEITREQATVLFAGVKGFKEHAETRGPEEVLKDLNEYFAIATTSILAYGGYVDKFVGDAVIAAFRSSPLQADHTERAVRSAVAMQKALQEAGKNGNRLLSKVGIGISSGVVLSGQMGSRAKKEYTFIGESFKVAYSLNVIASPGEIVISKDVYQLIEGLVSVEPVPPREMIDKTAPWENFRLQEIVERKDHG